ncbi:LptA/OstA family protein [uncultured Treponema sp.]|uniref:LptA/OstA family protein n=1 Tax=uncultured Treponema sp. TaxID=162155 RepID=UPI0025DA488D|nr:LptA/OstA family protein [uncultured Treponema sp.]
MNKNLLTKFCILFPLILANPLVHSEEIKFQADSMTGVSGSKNDDTKLIGNAFVKTSTMEIKADSIILNGDDFRYITAEGSVEGKNTETKMDFTCGKLRYDRQTKLARLEDSVHMIDLENDVTIDSQIIEYNQNKEIATMQIGVTLKQKNNTCTAAFAIYRKAAQMLEMSGNPKIVQGDDTFRAQEIVLNLESQEITLSGRVSGTVTDSKKEEPKKDEEKQPEEKSEGGDEKPELPSITDILNQDAQAKEKTENAESSKSEENEKSALETKESKTENDKVKKE